MLGRSLEIIPLVKQSTKPSVYLTSHGKHIAVSSSSDTQGIAIDMFCVVKFALLNYERSPTRVSEKSPCKVAARGSNLARFCECACGFLSATDQFVGDSQSDIHFAAPYKSFAT